MATPSPTSGRISLVRRTLRISPLKRQQATLLLCLLGLALLILPACSARLGSGVCSPSHGTTVPAQIDHNNQGAVLVIVQVTINGHGPYAFAFDTGASVSLIDQHLADSLSLPAAGAPQPVTGIGGDEEVTPVRITHWSVGKASLPPTTIVSGALTQFDSSTNVQGLLGSDVLSQVGAVTIDYDTSTVTIGG